MRQQMQIGQSYDPQKDGGENSLVGSSKQIKSLAITARGLKVGMGPKVHFRNIVSLSVWSLVALCFRLYTWDIVCISALVS